MSALDHALRYAELGWRLTPVRPRTKVPRVRRWQEVATDDVDQLTSWFTRWPDSGLSLATGEESGVWVLDVDPKEGGIETLKGLVAEFGELPKGPRVETGTNGFHLYFANPPGLRVKTTKRVGGTGVDVRGWGGQVLLPPTGHAWDQCKLCADPEVDCPSQDYRWHPQRDWSTPLPEAPQWLLDLVTLEPEPEPLPTAPTPAPTQVEDSAAAAISAEHNWHDLLLADGWQPAGQESNGDTLWTRPGKDKRTGISAVLHEPEGPLVNYSTNAPDLCQDWAANRTGDGWSYSIFGYLAATRYRGDRSACAADWRAKSNAQLVHEWAATSGGLSTPRQGPSDSREVNGEGTEGSGDDPPWAIEWIDWSSVFDSGEVFIDGLLIPGRWTALAAGAKVGKTTLMVFCSVELSQGRSPFTGEVLDCGPLPVLYVDAEMGRLDLLERLTEMHVDPLTLDRWHATDVPPRLDVPLGAQALLDAVEQFECRVVVIDGLNGVVAGAENDDTTWREFYRQTVAPLKRAGVALWTGDNLGKDKELGPRGSSVKVDKADAVIAVTRTDEGTLLKATHRRSGLFLSELPLKLEGYDSEGRHNGERVRYLLTGEARGWSAGIAAKAALLDRLDIDLQTGYQTARALADNAGVSLFRKESWTEVQEYRRAQLERRWREDAKVESVKDPDGFL